MIKASFRQEKSGKIALKVTGHAQNDEGLSHELICASASILAYTLAQRVQDMSVSGKLKKAPKIMVNSGDTLIEFLPKDKDMVEALFLVMDIQCGYALLAHNYSTCVELKTLDKA